MESAFGFSSVLSAAASSVELPHHFVFSGVTNDAKNLHPRYTSDAGKRSGKDGQFHGASHVKKQRAAERIPRISSPPLFGHFAVWVTVWVKPVSHT